MSLPMKTRKKLHIIITKSNFGGAQRYVYDLATELPKEAYDITVICGGSGLLVEKLRKADIRIHTIPSLGRDINIFKDLASFITLYRLFKKEQPDIIHLNSSKIGGIGGVAGRLAGIPKIIFTAHAWAFNENRLSISKYLIAFLHWITILLSTKTIAVSQATHTQIQKFPFIKNKVVTIHNGIPGINQLNLTDAKAALIAQVPKLATVHHNHWIGTLSELHPVKGLDILITAFATIAKAYPDYHLVICGEGQERKNLEHLIEKLQLSHRITLTGFVTDAKKYLPAFEIFTLTSRSEAFPYVLLEAGTAARPVIASAVGGIPEIITNKKSGVLIPKEDPQALIQALQALLTNPQQRSAYGKALSDTVNQRFTLTHMLDHTQAVYNAIT